MNKGFTLIELLISTSIFAIVTIFAISALLSLASSNDRAQAILTALNNLDFSADHMARTLRTGKNYNSGGLTCQGSGRSSINFDSPETGKHLEYRFEEAEGRIRKIIDGQETEFFYITAPEIDIDQLCFFIENMPDRQPRVLVLVSGLTRISGLTDDEQSDFNLQTTVSQRVSTK